MSIWSNCSQSRSKSFPWKTGTRSPAIVALTLMGLRVALVVITIGCVSSRTDLAAPPEREFTGKIWGSVRLKNTNSTLVTSEEPLSQLRVIAISLKDKSSRETNTGADGSYSIGQLSPGPYTVLFCLNGSLVSSRNAAVQTSSTTPVFAYFENYEITSAKGRPCVQPANTETHFH